MRQDRASVCPSYIIRYSRLQQAGTRLYSSHGLSISEGFKLDIYTIWLISFAVFVRFYNKHKTEIISTILNGWDESQNNIGCNPRTIWRAGPDFRAPTEPAAMLAINQMM
jgi:hypothetical protein